VSFASQIVCHRLGLLSPALASFLIIVLLVALALLDTAPNPFNALGFSTFDLHDFGLDFRLSL